MPLKIVKNICYYTLIGLDYLHRRLSTIQTNLNPENVFLVSAIDSSKDPWKNGKPLILPPQKSNETKQSLSSVLPRKPLNSATLNVTNLPTNSVEPKEPLISATAKPIASISTLGLTKNQKSKLRKKVKKLTLDNSKNGLLKDIPDPKYITAAKCLLHPWLTGAPYAPKPYVENQNKKIKPGNQISINQLSAMIPPRKAPSP